MVFMMMALAGVMRRVARSATDEAKRAYRPPIETMPVGRPSADAKPLPRKRRAVALGPSQPVPGEVTGSRETIRAGKVAGRTTGSLGAGQMEGLGAESGGPGLVVEDTGAYARGPGPTPTYATGVAEGTGAAIDASVLLAGPAYVAHGIVMSEVLGSPISAFAPARPRLLRRWRV